MITVFTPTALTRVRYASIALKRVYQPSGRHNHTGEKMSNKSKNELIKETTQFLILTQFALDQGLFKVAKENAHEAYRILITLAQMR